MTNEEVNKYIHVKIMGKCWHEWCPYIGLSAYWNYKCPYCLKESQDNAPNPDYCSDVSSRSLLRMVIEAVGDFTDSRSYVVHLAAITGGKIMKDILSEHQGYITKDWAYEMLRATAGQIARACVKAHQETQND